MKKRARTPAFFVRSRARTLTFFAPRVCGRWRALAVWTLAALCLTSCGGKPDGARDDTERRYVIGICQFASHPALDAAALGFRDAVSDALPGAEVRTRNAEGCPDACDAIVQGYVSENVDLIFANATASLQAAASATDTIPVLGASVTDYAAALGHAVTGTNVSGLSDLVPPDEQAALIREWFPDAARAGLLYCSSEANSRYQADAVQDALESLGFRCTRYTFATPDGVMSRTERAAAESDVIYIPTDNAAAAKASVIDSVCRAAGVPVVTGGESLCADCGVAALSINYYELGAAAGQMAVRILTGEADVSETPVEYAPQVAKKYNAAICAELGLTPPDGYEPIAGTE